jgi:hypothetical protein
VAHNCRKGKKDKLQHICDISGRNTGKGGETWRIPPEVVEEYKKIANFKASRHNMWIQEKRDPEKEWLQMRYCVTIEEVQWEMKDWKEEWKVPVEPTKDKKPSEARLLTEEEYPNRKYKKKTVHMKQTGGSATTRTLRQKKGYPQACHTAEEPHRCH